MAVWRMSLIKSHLILSSLRRYDLAWGKGGEAAYTTILIKSSFFFWATQMTSFQDDR